MLQQAKKRPLIADDGLQSTVRKQRWVELLCLFVFPPLLVLPQWMHIRDMVVSVIFVSAIIWYFHTRANGLFLFGNPYQKGATPLEDWRPVLRRVLLRFALCGSLLTVLVAYIAPQWFLALPVQRPEIWMMVMLLYPVVSVVLQEFPYRQLFFSRYAPLFPSTLSIYIANAMLFAWLHIPFINLPYGGFTVLLALIAGFFFADTYMRGRRFWLVWLEHTLYGNLIFTIGLGKIFYYNP